MEFGFVGLGFEAKPNEPKNHRKSILPASTRLDPPESTAFLGFDHQRINYVRPDIFNCLNIGNLSPSLHIINDLEQIMDTNRPLVPVAN